MRMYLKLYLYVKRSLVKDWGFNSHPQGIVEYKGNSFFDKREKNVEIETRGGLAFDNLFFFLNIERFT